jgi:hypothetical protein
MTSDEKNIDEISLLLDQYVLEACEEKRLTILDRVKALGRKKTADCLALLKAYRGMDSTALSQKVQ